MTKSALSRRQFLQASSTAAGVACLASTVPPAWAETPKNLTPKADPISIDSQQKAMVFIMLDGGNDSYNMLVPNSGQAYKDYQESRSNLALSKSDLLPLKGFKDKAEKSFSVHPAMPEVQELFANKELSFVANIGPLIRPLTRKNFMQGDVPLPVGLLSHSDQFKHWQTSKPGERINRGWFGDFADALQPNKAQKQISMNISLSGSNIMQNGVSSGHYTITDEGSVGLRVNEMKNELNDVILESFEQLLKEDYKNDPFKQNYLSITREAQAQHEIFKDAVKDIDVDSDFSDSALSKQLKMVARSIKAAKNLGMKQQTFFIRYIGWDHHDQLLENQQKMLGVVSKALAEFQTALQELEVDKQVVTFTGSDFGRTLTSNGKGTDHGWGGNTIVMGVPVDGGKVFGEYPDLTLGDKNPLDAGGGVVIPTTSTDQLYADLSLWFGVHKKSLPKMFPNLKNFYKLSSKQPPLGIIKATV